MLMMAKMAAMLAGDEGSAPATMSYIGKRSGVASGTTQTITAVDIGAADPNRIVVISAVGWFNSASVTITAATINGITATILQCSNTSGGQTGAGAIFYASVPTGTSVTVTFTFSASVSTYVPEMAVYRVIASSPIPVDTDFLSDTTRPKSLTLSGGSVGIAMTNSYAALAASSPVNMTQDSIMMPAISRPMHSWTIADPTLAFGCTVGSATSWALAGISWA